MSERRGLWSLDVQLLVLRWVNGAIFVVHGWGKLLDLPGLETGLAALGVPAAGVLAPLIGVIELFGGLLLITGIGTRLASLGHMVILLVGIYLVHPPWIHGLTGEGGMEFPLAVLTIAFVLLCNGSGRYSLARLLPSLSSSREPVSIGRLRWWAALATLALLSQIFPPSTAPVQAEEGPGLSGLGREVLEAERALWDRFEEGDVDAMIQTLDPDFTAFSGSMPERMDGPAAEEAHVRNFLEDLSGRVLEWKILEPRVQEIGEDAGVLTYLFSVTVSIQGEEQTRTGKNTSVWVRRGDRWRQAHYHYCYNPLSPPAEPAEPDG